MPVKMWFISGPSGDVFVPMPPGEEQESFIQVYASWLGDDQEDFTATECEIEVVKVNHIEEV